MNANTFESMSEWLAEIVADQQLHARWLNTLSYLENCGARMIASCEHPTKVKEEMLKHAAEEFRHAYHLKRQLRKLTLAFPLRDYSLPTLLGGCYSKHYLTRLNGAICRTLAKEFSLSGSSLKEHAYLLVTYAIERRASMLYPLYQQVLAASKSNISMRAIIAEEEGHLEEIETELDRIPNHERLKAISVSIEGALFRSLFEELLRRKTIFCRYL